MFITARWISESILPSVITRYLRRSIILSTCSFITGQASSHLRQVVHALSSSSVITSPINLIFSTVAAASLFPLQARFPCVFEYVYVGTHGIFLVVAD